MHLERASECFIFQTSAFLPPFPLITLIERTSVMFDKWIIKSISRSLEGVDNFRANHVSLSLAARGRPTQDSAIRDVDLIAAGIQYFFGYRSRRVASPSSHFWKQPTHRCTNAAHLVDGIGGLECHFGIKWSIKWCPLAQNYAIH